MELILVLPVLVIALLAIVEIGTYLLAVQAVQGAAMAGAREATLPGATSGRVTAAVQGALAGWSYAPLASITFPPPTGGSVSVTVSVNAAQAALNPLAVVPGLDLTGNTISAQFVMRQE